MRQWLKSIVDGVIVNVISIAVVALASVIGNALQLKIGAAVGAVGLIVISGLLAVVSAVTFFFSHGIPGTTAMGPAVPARVAVAVSAGLLSLAALAGAVILILTQ